MDEYVTPAYAREVQGAVELQLEFGDYDDAYQAVKEALEDRPGDVHLINVLYELLTKLSEVSDAQRSLYVDHLLIRANFLFQEKRNEEVLALLEPAYESGFYNREMIDLLCAVYSRLGQQEKFRELLNRHIDGASLEPDSGTDADLQIESANPDSWLEEHDTDSLDTI